MSVSKMTGKLMFALLAALALGGCVVATSTGDGTEDPSAKTEQSSTEKIGQDGNGQPAAGDTSSTSTTPSISNGTVQAEPQPLPWIKVRITPPRRGTDNAGVTPPLPE